ncbi:hypothetical protein GCM10025859_47190 [Alicyclobacillus fastidiosus]|nr:hypothetical protein GCM10025859_47190 [Alicyclobacillus fastidiosus]
MREILKRGMATVASVGMISVLIAGCGTNSTSVSTGNASSSGTSLNSKPVKGGSITVDMTQAVPDLDPAIEFDTVSQTLSLRCINNWLRIQEVQIILRVSWHKVGMFHLMGRRILSIYVKV